jgi:hypothetical protein
MTKDERDFQKNLEIVLAQVIEKQIDEFLLDLPKASPKERLLFKRACWMAMENVVKERLRTWK